MKYIYNDVDNVLKAGRYSVLQIFCYRAVKENITLQENNSEQALTKC